MLYSPGSNLVIGCPIGTFNPSTGSSRVDDCLPCPSGYFCGKTGISDYSSLPCPQGFVCGEGVTNPTPCPGGTYGSAAGFIDISQCSGCHETYYCPPGSASPIACPPGSICPYPNMINFTLCPPGNFSIIFRIIQ